MYSNVLVYYVINSVFSFWLSMKLLRSERNCVLQTFPPLDARNVKYTCFLALLPFVATFSKFYAVCGAKKQLYVYAFAPHQRSSTSSEGCLANSNFLDCSADLNTQTGSELIFPSNIYESRKSLPVPCFFLCLLFSFARNSRFTSFRIIYFSIIQ